MNSISLVSTPGLTACAAQASIGDFGDPTATTSYRLCLWAGGAPLGWHLYTEAWGYSSANRWDSAAINQYAAPWWGNMPGWGKPGYWQYESAAADANPSR